jgi:hypothetical protein
MRPAGPLLLVVTVTGASVAGADPAPGEVNGNGATQVTVPPAQPLDSNAAPARHAVTWTQVASAADAATAPLWANGVSGSMLMAGGIVGLSRPLSWGLFGAQSYLSGSFSVMSSQLSLRPPSLLGIQPLFAVGYSQLLTGPTGYAEVGARFAEGPLHLGWHLHLAERLGGGGPPLLTSTSYARYETRRWDVGIDHVAQLALWGSVFRRDLQYLTVSAGVKPVPEAPTIRAGTTIPLRPVAAPSSRLAVFGTF